MLDVLIHRLRLGAAGMAAAALAVGLSGAAQAQTLVTWDDYTDVGQNAVIEQLNKAFVAAHPGVTINRTARTFDDLSMTLKLTVAAGNGPQVTKVNQGAADQGTMVKQKLLLPIDDYVKQYGWDKRFGAGVLARMQWSDSGQFGEGHYYGVSGLGEMVGLYYNQKVLTDAGISGPPKTYEELRDASRALDRIVTFGHYQVPQLYAPWYSVSYWNKFGIPKTYPKYYTIDESGDWPVWAVTAWWSKDAEAMVGQASGAPKS